MKLSNTEKKILNTLITNQDHVPAMDVEEIAANIAQTQQYTKTWVNKLHGRNLIADMDVNGENTVYHATDAGEEALENWEEKEDGTVITLTNPEADKEPTQEERTLKYKGFEEGDVIKAYDIEKREWIEDGEYRSLDLFLVGRVTGVGRFNPLDGFTTDPDAHGYKAYRVDVIHDTAHVGNPPEEAFVPMESDWFDWEGRITKLNEAQSN